MRIGDTLLSEELAAALDCDDPNYCVGISCPCCGARDYAFYRSRLSEYRLAHRVTYANIFSNGNWDAFDRRIVQALRQTQRRVIIVTHWDKDFDYARATLTGIAVEAIPTVSARYDQPIGNHYISRRCCGGSVLWYCSERQAARERFAALAASVSDAIFLVQLGPIANVLIHEMFLCNKRNTYLDMGHSLDPVLFGTRSREFHFPHTATAICVDMEVDWKPFSPR
jgi:hypothetical protein